MVKKTKTKNNKKQGAGTCGVQPRNKVRPRRRQLIGSRDGKTRLTLHFAGVAVRLGGAAGSPTNSSSNSSLHTQLLRRTSSQSRFPLPAHTRHPRKRHHNDDGVPKPKPR